MQFVCKYSDVFKEMHFKMRPRPFIICIIMLLFSMDALCVPARKSPVYLRQPDGSVFQAHIKGDEFTRIKTTASGHAIVQDNDGWWCYASYTPDGKKSSTGWKVGDDAPASVLMESLEIPYARLSEKAAARRRSIQPEEAALKRINRLPSTKGTGMTKHGLVILANFSDVKFNYGKEDFERLLNEEGYSVNAAKGSAKEYFDEQFQGLLEFEFHVTDIVTLPKNRAYYGGNDSDGNDKKPAEMIRDACIAADEQIDFSLFDDDKDGEVDNVFVFFAGQDEAEGADEECIWSHAWYLGSGAGIRLELDGMVIDRYACTSEISLAYTGGKEPDEYISTIGTFCHEYSHTLGLPDFYDTDYEESGGIAAGLWTRTSLMDGGNYNDLGRTPPYYNALERMIAGISEPKVLEKSGTYTLDPVHKNGDSYILKTENENEFFLFECREHYRWDKNIGGTGMLAYHIDLTSGSFEDWLSYNEVNTDPLHQNADLLEADGRSDAFSGMEAFNEAKQNIAGIFYPYDDSDSISADTTPGLVNWDGSRSGCIIESIRKEENGSRIKFNFLGNDNVRMPPAVVNITKDVFADAAIIGFESSYAFDGEAVLAWGRSGNEKDTLKVTPYETGKYAVVLERLESAGKTYDLDIFFTKDGMEGETVSTSIMTKRMPSVKWPYIYFGNAERNADGSFPKGARLPLRIYGATGAAEIGWTFNDMPISVGGDGYYTLKTGGILEAIIFWEDGSVDKVMKEIRITE